MKKQLLILSMFVLAIISSTLTGFGQVKNPDTDVWIAPLNCSASPLSPTAGELYEYEVEIPATPGYTGIGTYDWYVTKHTDLLDLTNAGFYANATNAEFTVDASGSAYHASTGTSDIIAITWTAAAVATGTPYYLVVNYTETNTSGDEDCPINNVKVYRIMPLNAFWLDINPTNTGTIAGIPSFDMSDNAFTFDICSPEVASAIVTDDGDATFSVAYDYGQTVIQTIIHAGGYTGDWDGTIRISGLQENQEIASATWTNLTTTGPENPITLPTPTAVIGTPEILTATLPSTNVGTDILITITIDQNQHESLADQVIEIAVDGSYTAGGTTFNDKSDAVTDCGDEASYADYVKNTVKARPTVNDVPATTGDFITPLPALH